MNVTVLGCCKWFTSLIVNRDVAKVLMLNGNRMHLKEAGIMVRSKPIGKNGQIDP